MLPSRSGHSLDSIDYFHALSGGAESQLMREGLLRNTK